MIYVAILGFGVVGGGCASLLTENANNIEKLLGDKVEIKHILDLRKFPDSPFLDIITDDFNKIVNDDSVSVVIETMGGARPAYDFTVSCLEKGKSVVTSNKEVVSKFGDVLIECAKKHGAEYLFEASVGGGIPLIRTIAEGIKTSNEIKEITGILNGTTNYILTRMFGCGASFEDALKEAQEKGYAEKDPTADVTGLDAARKTNILAALATSYLAGEELIYTEGITKITKEDVENAKRVNCEIKLLGRIIIEEDGAYAYCAPHFVPKSNMLSNINGVYNGVSVCGNFIGDILLYGQGAGAKATASAVVSDVINAASKKNTFIPSFARKNGFPKDFSNFEVRRYISFEEGENIEKAALVFGDSKIISGTALISDKMSEKKYEELKKSFKIKNMIRVLN